MNKTRQNTIQYALPNLRYRWPELVNLPDNELAALYEDFSLSDEFGDNDEKFPLWVKQVFDLDI